MLRTDPIRSEFAYCLCAPIRYDSISSAIHHRCTPAVASHYMPACYPMDATIPPPSEGGVAGHGKLFEGSNWRKVNGLGMPSAVSSTALPLTRTTALRARLRAGATTNSCFASPQRDWSAQHHCRRYLRQLTLRAKSNTRRVPRWSAKKAHPAPLGSTPSSLGQFRTLKYGQKLLTPSTALSDVVPFPVHVHLHMHSAGRIRLHPRSIRAMESSPPAGLRCPPQKVPAIACLTRHSPLTHSPLG